MSPAKTLVWKFLRFPSKLLGPFEPRSYYKQDPHNLRYWADIKGESITAESDIGLWLLVNRWRALRQQAVHIHPA